MINLFQRNDMLIKRFLKSIFLTLYLISQFHDGYCDEIYYIENSPLFLYKTINCWYDSLPKESNQLCGRPIKCSNDGNAQIGYDKQNKKMELKIKDGFATMLLAFKKCKQCYGPSYLNCTWLDQKYFRNTTATVILNSNTNEIIATFNMVW